MRHIFSMTIFGIFVSSHAIAQSEPKLPELPAAAGTEATQPSLPAPASTYDSIPAAEPNLTPPPQRTMTDEEVKRLKQDENWLVEGMKQKQEEAAAALASKKSAELNDLNKEKKEADLKENSAQPGEMSTFKPVVADNSLASLNINQTPGSNPNSTKKKNNTEDPLALPGNPSASNPLTTSSSTLVQPILGPSRQPLNTNVASLNPGLTLPETGIKKISSNPNFIPEGYADSWTKQQQQSPYAPLIVPQNKPVLPPVPVTPRPTFRDLANTIPDPTQVR